MSASTGPAQPSPATSTPQPTTTTTTTTLTSRSRPTQTSHQPSAQDPSFPAPQLFDILPALHELLSRLLAASSSSLAQPNGATQSSDRPPTANGPADTQASLDPETQSQSQSQSQTQVQTQPPQPQSQPEHQQTQSQSQLQSQTQTDTQTQAQTQPQALEQTQSQTQNQIPTYPSQQPLQVKDIAAEVSTIRNMIRRAREAVAALPDVDRAIDEQEQEMAYLQAQVARLQGVLGGLKEAEDGTQMQE